jgi:twitching motility protein PilT
MELNSLLQELCEQEGSDLHLQPEDPPVIRLNGDLAPLGGDRLAREDTERMFEGIASEKSRTVFKEDGAADFSYELEGFGRFRVNAFRQRGSLAMVFRRIPMVIPSFEQLQLPPIIQSLSESDRGLILVVGVTGSGKSTTLASMIDHVNQTTAKRIITVEDPIEYVHKSKKSIISQRELGDDAVSFSQALRSALRQDPDTILVGELRDLATIRTAIRAAETGHLVFSTLHTNDTVQTVDRMVGHFPSEERNLARTQVAMNLRAVIAQRLVKSADGQSRIPAVEILVNNSLVQKMLLTDKVKDLYQVLKNRQDGMQSFDICLLDLVKAEKVTEEEALRYAANPSALKRMIAGGMSDSDRGGILAF